MVCQCINIRQVPCGVLKTAASGVGFQHHPGDLANVNAWKTKFNPYIKTVIEKKEHIQDIKSEVRLYKESSYDSDVRYRAAYDP